MAANNLWIVEFETTAAEHRAGDIACGRPWQCTCAACIQIREGITKTEWLRRMVAEKQKSMKQARKKRG